MSIQMKGCDMLIKHLQNVTELAEVERVVKKHTARLQESAMRHAENFKGHYKNGVFIKPTRTLKRSISIRYEMSGFMGVVWPTVDYAAYVEYGTRFMAAQPYMRPALVEVETEFRLDLQAVMG